MSKVHQICPICAACNTKQKDGYYMCCACRHKWRDVESSSVFDRITQSEETLAERLVYSFPLVDREGQVIIAWYSSIEKGRWFTKTEAIAATVAKLKEVAG